MHRPYVPRPATENGRMVCLVLGRNTKVPSLGDSEMARILASGDSVVFQSGRLLQNAIMADARWAQIATCAANHAYRSDDDALHLAAQATARQMVACLEDWLPKHLRTDFTRVAEVVAQATADHFVLVDILADCVKAECDRLQCSTVKVFSHSAGDDLVLGIRGALSRRDIVVLQAGLRLVRPIRKKETEVHPRMKPVQGSTLRQLGKQLQISLREPIKTLRTARHYSRAALGPELSQAEVLFFFDDREANYGPNVAAILPELEGMRVCLASLKKSATLPPLKDRFDTMGHAALDVVPKKHGRLAKNEREAMRKFRLEFRRRLWPQIACQFGVKDCDVFYVTSALNELFQNLEMAIAYFRSFRRALAESALRAVVLSPSRSVPARALTIAANDLGIATFDLPTGTLTRSHRQWPPIASQILASDRSARDIYTEFFRLDAARVTLVGSPRLDAAVARLKALGTPERPPGSVFLALQHLTPEVNLSLVRMVAEAAAQAGLRSITVGFHPRDSEHARRTILREMAAQPVAISVCEGPSLPEINRHETCVTFFSFIGFEAFALGTRVIAVNPTSAPWPMRLAEAGLAEEACSAEDLAKLFATPTPSPNENVRDTAILRDGGAARRIRAALAAAHRAAPERRTPSGPD